MCLFLLLHLLHVELEFLTFENIAIATSALSRSGANASVDGTLAELGSELIADGGGESSLEVLVGDALAALLLFPVEVWLVVLEVLLLEAIVLLADVVIERSGIDGDDGILYQSLRSDQLVVGGVVDSVDDRGLSGDTLGLPSEVAEVKSQSSELSVSSLGPDEVNSLLSNLGVSDRSGSFELPLLLVDWHLTTG